MWQLISLRMSSTWPQIPGVVLEPSKRTAFLVWGSILSQQELNWLRVLQTSWSMLRNGIPAR
jgi:hypothetical protein